MSEQNPGGFEQLKKTMIVLPDNPELKQRLAKKQQEYAARIDRYKQDVGTIEGVTKYADSLIKNMILSQLLVDGHVNLFDIAQNIPADEGNIGFDDVLANAFSVIKAYAEEDEGSVSKGTGLPS